MPVVDANPYQVKFPNTNSINPKETISQFHQMPLAISLEYCLRFLEFPFIMLGKLPGFDLFRGSKHESYQSISTWETKSLVTTSKF